MDKEIKAIVDKIVSLFRTLKGASFVGISGYLNSAKELANHVVICDFNYGIAVNKSIDLLNKLEDSDFSAIAEKYGVCNESGIRYCNGKKNQQLYIVENKALPKEGTKAREDVLKSIKVTKTLKEVRNQMVSQFLANRDADTRSAQSQAVADAYVHITNSIKVCKETKQIHIYALHHSKVIMEDGIYTDSEKYLETLQKEAISKYLKYE